MSAHAPDHADLVRRMLLGEVDAASAEVRQRMTTCEVCRAEWTRLQQAEGLVSRVVALEKADIEEAVREVDPADEAFVRASLAGVLPPPARRRLALGPFVWTAAAVVLAAFLVVRALVSDPERARPPETLLHEDGLRCLGPVGPVDDFTRFFWEFEGPAGTTFELYVRVHEEDGAGRELLVQPDLVETSWTLTAEQGASLPDRIVWEVVARGIDDRRLASGRASAWRR